MAATTRTATAASALVQPRVPHSGLFIIDSGQISMAALTFSVSDLILMCKVPNKVTVYDWLVMAQTPGTSKDVQVNIGSTIISASITAATATAMFGPIVNGVAGSLPLKVSLSDDASPLYSFATIRALTDGTGTTSMLFRIWLFCSRDEQVGYG